MKGGNLSRIILTQLDMSKPKSTNGTQTAQLLIHSKDAATVDQTDVQMVQNVLLIWLEINYRNSIKHLRSTVNTVNIFIDSEEWVEGQMGLH